MSIPKPKYCGQDWLEMQEADGGRICGKCENLIVDFRKKSWSDIRSIQASSNNTTCGLYSKKQLNNWDPPSNSKFGFNAAAASVLLGMSQLISNTAAAQEKPAVIQTIHKSTDSLKNINTQVEQLATIKGKVIDQETGEAIPFVKIVITQNDIQKAFATTDFDGLYQLNVPADSINNYTLSCIFVGYEKVEIENIAMAPHKTSIYDIEMRKAPEHIAFFITVPTKKEKRKAKRKARKEAKKAQKKEQ